MERNRLTFLVITDPSKPAQTVEVTRRTLKFAITGAVTFALLVLVGAMAVVLNLGNLARAERLERENSLLVADVQRMRETVGQLTQSLTEISERDRQFRVLAGLPEIDPEVRQVGIGGPGTASMEGEPLLELDTGLGVDVFNATTDLNRLLRQSNLLGASLREAARAVETRREEFANFPSIDPTAGWLSSTFSRSRFHPLLNVRRPHEGIDFSAPRGTPVLATGGGVVTFAGWRPGFGWTVEIDHGKGLKTRYAHNEKNLKVKAGDRVVRGDPIALVGSSGQVTGPHVHYEVIQDGRAVNPADFRLSDVIVE